MTAASSERGTGQSRLERLRSVLIPARSKLGDGVVLIVGGSRGLGLDLCRNYADKGCRIALCARDPEEIERARRDLSARGAEVFAAVCDATQEQDVQRFVSSVFERFGAIDVLITNAAAIQVGPFEAMTRDDFEEAMASIFWGTYFATLATLPFMRKQGSGHIVHITSFGGKISVPHLLPYCTAKFAATGFSQGLRAAVAHDGIQVTTVTPGLLRTGAQVNVPFKGQHQKELLWFSAGTTLPFLSLSSERAARRIVKAVERGDTECTLSTAVRLMVLASALAPSLTAKLLILQNELMPPGNGNTTAKRGADVAFHSSSKLVRVFDALGRNNAIQHHAYPGPVKVAAAARRHGDTLSKN